MKGPGAPHLVSLHGEVERADVILIGLAEHAGIFVVAAARLDRPLSLKKLPGTFCDPRPAPGEVGR